MGRRKEKFYELRGLVAMEVERGRSAEVDIREELEQRDKEVQELHTETRIRNGKYNTIYRKIKTPGVPRYLKERG